MPDTKSYSEHWHISYNKANTKTNDIIKNLSLSYENLDIDGIRQNLNMFLAAIGIPLEVVNKK